MSKIKPYKRDLVFLKYGGLCAYCGCELTVLNFTIDHIVPIILKPENKNDLSNLNPCCDDCNPIKSEMSIEEFRNFLETLNETFIMAKYRILKKYGLAIPVEKNIKFYFEKL